MMKCHRIKATRRIRFLSVFLTLLIVCAFIPAKATAVIPLTVSVGTGTATAGGGDVAVNIDLANVAANLPRGINNSGFTIQYDNTVLEIVSAARGSLITNAVDMDINPSTVAEINANTGNIVLLHSDDTVGLRSITSDGTYAVLTFKAKAGAAVGTYPLTFKAGASSIGQINAAGTYAEDVNMANVVLSAGAIDVQAAPPIDPLTVSIGTATATAGGENVAVNIDLANVVANLPRGINNSGFTIQYDNTVLEIVSAARGSLITNAVDMDINPSTVAEINANTGNIVLLHSDDTVGLRSITSDGTYAVLTFKAKAGAAVGTYPLTFKAGASSMGQINTAGTYAEDVNMATVVLSAGAIDVQAAPPIDPLTVSIGTATATAGGENVAVNIDLANVVANLPRGINNSGFTIQYDNTVLEIVSAARGSLITNAVDMDINPSTVAEISANTGNIVLLHSDDTVGLRSITSDGTYAVLTFKAKAGAAVGTYPLTFKAGASSMGQINTAGTYADDVNMATVVLNAGAINVESTNDNCFIATASFGSKFEPSVVLLRQFRDQYLLSNSPGKAFVKFYYDNSPPIAAFIAQNEGLKAIVRGVLTPAVGVVYLIFHPQLTYTLASILLIVCLMGMAKRRKGQVNHPKTIN